MSNLSIVWRNPIRIQSRRRWMPQVNVLFRQVYVVQELTRADCDIWTNVAALEVTAGCAEPKNEKPAKNWAWRVKW